MKNHQGMGRMQSWAMMLGLMILAPAAWGQAPQWMSPLEGSYVGRLEIYTGQAPAGEKTTSFVRLDGKRDASGNGFVLQWLQGRDSASVQESLGMWQYDRATGQVVITETTGSKPVSSHWYITSTNALGATLVRGGSHQDLPALLRWNVERLPGQLRLSHAINRGDGKWVESHAYILEDVEINAAPSSPQPRQNAPRP